MGQDTGKGTIYPYTFVRGHCNTYRCYGVHPFGASHGVARIWLHAGHLPLCLYTQCQDVGVDEWGYSCHLFWFVNPCLLAGRIDGEEKENST